jgi:hypothetical protein
MKLAQQLQVKILYYSNVAQTDSKNAHIKQFQRYLTQYKNKIRRNKLIKSTITDISIDQQ